MLDLALKFLCLVPFYLLGAFPTGTIIAARSGVSLKDKGSGSVGATNVARLLGKKAGVLTLIGDVLKGALGIFISRLIQPDVGFQSLCGFVLVLGHCISIPGRLKGGKGIATALGVILSLSPFSAFVGLTTFALVFAWKKIVSLASISAAVIIPIAACLWGVDDNICKAFIAISALSLYRHKANLKRLIEGNEPIFSSSKSRA